jgi:hypothetical protein
MNCQNHAPYSIIRICLSCQIFFLTLKIFPSLIQVPKVNTLTILSLHNPAVQFQMVFSSDFICVDLRPKKSSEF